MLLEATIPEDLELESVMDQTTSQIYKRLLSYVGNYKSIAILAVIGMIGYSAMDALFIQLMKPFIDQGLNERNSDVLKYAPYVVVALVFGRGFFNYMSSYCLSYVGSQVVRSLRQQLFEHILHLPVSFHDKNSSGDLISKITFDTEQVQQAITKAMLIVVREGAFVVFLLTVMFYTSWKLSLIFLIIIPLVAVIVSIVSKRFRHISKNIQSAMGQVTRSSEQMLSGHKVIHGFGGQKQEIDQFATINNHNRQQRIKMDATKALSVSVIQILAASAMAVILFVVSMPSMIDTISSGDFVVLISSMMMLLRPLKQLANVNSDLQRGISAAQSIFLVLDEEVEKDTGTISVDKVKGLIEVLWDQFGGTLTEKGFKRLDSHIGSIYGDSITLERQKEINDRLIAKGFAPEVVLGVGSYSYQYVTRDTHGSAMKATNVMFGDKSQAIYKEPKTDMSKKSARGLIKVVREDGKYKAIDEQSRESWFADDNCLEVVYLDGKIIKETSLAEIRALAHLQAN